MTNTRILSIDVGIKNLALCLLDGPDQIEFWEVFDIGNTTDTTRHLTNLYKKLDSTPIIWDKTRIKTIVIEKQPSFNPKMRTMASALHMFFVMKGFKHIIQYSPKYKLQLCKDISEYEGSTTYAKNKKRSIDTTRYFISLNPVMSKQWLSKFNSAKKKDDFADSYLQGVSYYKVYKRATREMKKPSKTTLATPKKLEEVHFSWLWNLWKQEHATVLVSRTRPARGPMDKYATPHMESEEEYSIDNYIEDILTDKVDMKKRIEELYGNIRSFVEHNEELEDNEELEELEEPEV
tara:strand:+ start:3351 stop:4226 length:876 start_codon:yes stop_codon:yes gene_type:complete